MTLTIKTYGRATRAMWITTVLLTAAPLALSATGQKAPTATKNVAAETPSQAEARAILMKMANFLASTQTFSVSLRGGYDAVQASGQKIEFGESRTITVSRPNRLRVEGERSDGAKTLVILTGKEIVLVDLTSKVYATTPQPGPIDDSVVYFVRDLGMRLPLAALLLSRLPSDLQDRVRSVDYVEKTTISGVPSHHLAARGDTVDYQVWVADGDKPLPQRIVLTYKKAVGQPQYWAQFMDWNLEPKIDDATFSGRVPDGLQKIAFAAQLPHKPTAPASARKGAK
jgi:hypothetical protein